MKKDIKAFARLAILSPILLIAVSCNEDEMFNKEQYEKIVCLVSDDDFVFSVDHSLEQEESVGYLSVVVGGSKMIDQDVTIEFEPDNELLDRYNKVNFDIETDKFAKLLPTQRYNIPSMSVTMQAGSNDQYVLFPIHVKTEGISPDTTYVIPLRIKSISNYKLHPEKTAALYRVRIQNKYATQTPVTLYSSKGTSQTVNQEIPEAFSTTKTVFPISGKQIRMYAGKILFDDKNVTEEGLKQNSVIVEINDDNTLKILPYGTIQVEKLGTDEDNFYNEQILDNQKRRSIYLYYRYRLQINPPTESAEAEYGEWITINEIMRRVEG